MAWLKVMQRTSYTVASNDALHKLLNYYHLHVCIRATLTFSLNTFNSLFILWMMVRKNNEIHFVSQYYAAHVHVRYSLNLAVAFHSLMCTPSDTSNSEKSGAFVSGNICNLQTYETYLCNSYLNRLLYCRQCIFFD